MATSVIGKWSTRLRGIAALVCLGAAVSCGGERSREANAAVPNVVLITVDTLRADHLGCYSYPLATSPNIDALAAEGVLFEQAVSSAPSTGPSVASMMTGKYPRFNSYGYDNGRGMLVPDERTLAEVFQEAGYATAAFVCNPVLSWRSGLDQGFEHFDEEMHEEEQIRGVRERTAQPATDAVLDWLTARDDPRPLFLWVHYQDPHGPYTPPEGLFEPFLPADKGRALQPCARRLGSSPFNCIPGYQRLEKPLTIGEYVARYDGEIAYVDRELGRLLTGLRRSGLYDDTVVLFTADHGEAFGENQRYFQHGYQVSRDQSHVPMILRGPGVARGRRVAIPVGHVDVFRTLAAVAGSGPESSGIESAVDLRWLDQGQAPDRTLYCDIGQRLAVHDANHLLAGRPRYRSEPDAGGESVERADFEGERLADLGDPFIAIEDPQARARLVEAANRYLSLPQAEFRTFHPDEEHRKELESLGYVQGD